ncbi:MAG: TetR family transcriptional regulator [Anaerofustis sp.]
MKRIGTENERKRKLFEAAQFLFYEQGYIGTSLNDMIERSETNKGTFYHYYKSKAELGLSVYEKAFTQHREVYSLFPNENALTLISVDNRIFWSVFFKDFNFRRFFTDLIREGVHFTSSRMVEDCLQFSAKRFSYNKLSLINASSIGFRSNTSLHVYDNLDDYSAEEISTFNLKQFFQLYEIPQEDIEHAISRSLLLFEQLQITTDRFEYHANPK